MGERVDALLQRAAEHIGAGRLREATSVIEPLIAASMAAGDQAAEASARFMSAQVAVAKGDRELARHQAAAALEIAERLGEEAGAEHIRTFCSWLEAPTGVEAALAGAAGHLQAGRPREAAEAIAEVLPTLDPGTPDEASAQFLLAQARVALGDREAALACIERAIAVARQRDDPAALAHFEAFKQGLSGGEEDAFASVIALLHEGRAAEAADRLQDMLPTVPTGTPAEASACSLLSQALWMDGRAAEGMPYAERALELAVADGRADVIAHFKELADDIRAAME